jgi:hypothetical protein
MLGVPCSQAERVVILDGGGEYRDHRSRLYVRDGVAVVRGGCGGFGVQVLTGAVGAVERVSRKRQMGESM